MSYKILAINPGSTSTKIALYEDEKEVFSKTLEHDKELLESFDTIKEQLEMRKKYIMEFLQEKNISVDELDTIVARGGMLPPVKTGAYEINETMVNRLIYNPILDHASNLAAPIAYELSKTTQKKSYIYDCVRSDELIDIARITGMPDIPRTSTCHFLNTRAMAIKAAKGMGKSYSDLNIIVAHLGGGISVSIHQKGKVVDLILDDEGPFAPERAGRVSARALTKLCYSGKYDLKTMQKKLSGNGGLKAHLNTIDAREVVKMINEGNEKARLVYEAMAYQVSKGIGELATVVSGDVDIIILTGGIAHSTMFTDWIEKRVAFIAPVKVMPGENELEALAYGGLRVLRNEEQAKEYIE